MSMVGTPSAGATDDIGRATHLFFLLFGAMCLVFGAWAYYGKLDIVSRARGEVIPSSQLKSVQHLEGGIVKKILVAEGDTVKQGQELVILESTARGADVNELDVRIAALRVEIARLDAEAAGKEAVEFDPDLIEEQAELVRQTANLFGIRRTRLQNELEGQEELVTQRQQDISEIRARMKNNRHNLKLIQEQIDISNELLKDDLTNRYNHLSLLREGSDLKSRIEEDAAALRGAEAALKEAQVKQQRITHVSQEEARKELESLRRELEEGRQRIRKYRDSLQRTVLRSPVNGVVKALHLFTVGGVVKPGESVMDIVPAGDQLIIEAQLPTQDIGYVQVGQPAMIRLATADVKRLGNLEGEVIHVSADAFLTEEGTPFYKVRIATTRDYFQRGDLRYQLFPGMEVMASIRTGQRTVLEYLLSPFIDSLGESLGER